MSAVNWKLAVAQMDCTSGDVAANLGKIERFCRAASGGGAQLVVFPEAATTGYFLGDRLRELAEPANGKVSRSLAAIARGCRTYLAVGAYTKDGSDIRNSQYLFSPDGQLQALYHKAHLFASERAQCRPGDMPIVVKTAIGRVALTICYDLIFPDYIRRLVELGAELILNSTCWITDSYQRDFWGWQGPTAQSIAAVRALENGTFIAMADRVGREVLDPPGILFDGLGYSTIAGPSGKILSAITTGEGLAIADVALAEEDLEKWRGIATYARDRRPELYS
jgi:5-aminopentanamidase